MTACMCVCGGKVWPDKSLWEFNILLTFESVPYISINWMNRGLNAWMFENQNIAYNVTLLYCIYTKRAIKMRNEWGREFNRENIDILNLKARWKWTVVVWIWSWRSVYMLLSLENYLCVERNEFVVVKSLRVECWNWNSW